LAGIQDKLDTQKEGLLGQLETITTSKMVLKDDADAIKRLEESEANVN